MRFIELCIRYRRYKGTQHQDRELAFYEPVVDNGDIGYIREMLDRLPKDVRDWVVSFCEMVGEAMKGEGDDIRLAMEI